MNIDPLQPLQIQALLCKAPFQWWITGGWALDLFGGEQWRPHFDIDVAIARCNQSEAQHYLRGWDFQYVLPGSHDPVVFHQWERGQVLDFKIHGSWARENTNSPWRFEFLLHEIDRGFWSFRYCMKVRRIVSQIGCLTADGIPYLRPEIALLYKAARLRDVDDKDFRRILPRLVVGQRSQLAADIALCWPDHPWIAALK